MNFRPILSSILLTVPLVFLACGEDAAPTQSSQDDALLTVTSPKKGESYPVGGGLPITWAATTGSGEKSLVIDISFDGEKTWTELTSESIPNSLQSYEWTIPESLSVYDRTLGDRKNRSTKSSEVYIMIYEYDGEGPKVHHGPFTIR